MTDPAVISAAFAALASIISALLVYRVAVVQRAVNGHTTALDAKIEGLTAALVATSREVVPPTEAVSDGFGP